MAENDNADWKYNPSQTDDEDRQPAPSSVAWQAPEFIEHHHGAGWYGLLILVTIVITAVVYLITKDIFATSVMPVIGVIVGVFAGHKPSVAQYEIASRGLSINGKNYPYGLFKSFSILQEGDLSSVNLFPVKRFMPPVAAYFTPADEDKITNALGDHLPYENRPMDGIDKLSRRLRL